MPELHPLLAGRWSPRGFDGLHEVGHAELASLLEAARWAPSAGNGQPWRFAIGRRDDETHKRIFECLARDDQRWAWRASALVAAGYVDTAATGASGTGGAATGASGTGGGATAGGPTTGGPTTGGATARGPAAGGPAPVVPTARRPAGDTAGSSAEPGPRRSDNGYRAIGAAYDLGQAVAHLGLQASALDLHTHQLTDFDAARLHRELELPDAVTVHAVVAVGRLGDPAVLPRDLQVREFRLRERRPVDALLLA